MIEKKIAVEGATTLTLLEMASQVALIGWDKPDVLVRLKEGSEEDLTVEQMADGPVLSARVGCEIYVPGTLRVMVREVAASLEADGVSNLEADEVHGHAQLRQVNKATLTEVYGDLRTEEVASLQVTDAVYGNATLSAGSTAELREVRGNLQAVDLDSLNSSRIGGNLTVQDLAGPLVVERVGGNATLKSIAGPLTLEKVGGNLVAKDLTAGARVSKIGGNLALNGELGTGCTYHFRAGGNAALRLSSKASAHLTLRAKGAIKSSLTLEDSERQANTLTGTLGEGGAEIVIEAGGNILLGGTEPAFGTGLGEDLSREISRQIEESLRAIDLAAVGQQISAEMERAMSQLRVKLESMDWERIGQQTQRSVERALERMQRDIDRMAEKAARRQEKLERMAERAAREKELRERASQRMAERQTWRATEGRFSPAEEPGEPRPNLDQERLAILKMVEQGKISPQEAEMLLAALE